MAKRVSTDIGDVTLGDGLTLSSGELDVVAGDGLEVPKLGVAVESPEIIAAPMDLKGSVVVVVWEYLTESLMLLGRMLEVQERVLVRSGPEAGIHVITSVSSKGYTSKRETTQEGAMIFDERTCTSFLMRPPVEWLTINVATDP